MEHQRQLTAVLPGCRQRACQLAHLLFLLPEGLGQGKAPAQGVVQFPAQLIHRRGTVAFQSPEGPEDGQTSLEQQSQPAEEGFPVQVSQRTPPLELFFQEVIPP